MLCDVVIPVYKSPEWVRLCVHAVFSCTDSSLLGKVIAVNDCDDEATASCLRSLASQYGEKFVVLNNPQNLGFVKTANRGLQYSQADYVLLLNSDCILSPGTIEKLIGHFKADSSVGLASPLASNAANLSIPMFPGFSHVQMDDLMASRFPKKSYPACTIVGNCLMISRRCIDACGYLDEAFSPGYAEETDYQFRAMSKGLKARAAVDTYVFHKSEASFGSSAGNRMREEHTRLFYSRWKKEFFRELNKYRFRNVSKIVNFKLPGKYRKPRFHTLEELSDYIVVNARNAEVISGSLASGNIIAVVETDS